MKIAKKQRLFGLFCLLALLAATVIVAMRFADKGPARPQTPVSPVPYKDEQVSFENATASVRLAGTLTLPTGPGPYPAIVLVPGAGEVTRDGSLFGHHFYLVLADYLTKRGFAVLRSDKRGIGQSGGDYRTATTLDFASDIEAGVAFLRSRRDIDPKRVGLIGHSEGGLIGAKVASKDRGIAFLVMMAGNGIRGDEMLLIRTRRFAFSGRPRNEVERELELQRTVFAALKSNAASPEVEPTVRQLYLAARDQYGRPFSEDDIPPLLTPWMRTFLALDPQPILEQLECPTLALLGEKDQAVTAEENAPALERALAANIRAQVTKLPGLNHFFQTAKTGQFPEIAEIQETMSPSALDLIGTWAERQIQQKP